MDAHDDYRATGWVLVPGPRTLTLPEVAQVLRVSERTVRRMVKRGEQPCVRVGHQLRFPLRRILALAEGEAGDGR